MRVRPQRRLSTENCLNCAFELWWWWRLLSPVDGKEIKLINLKGNQPWIFTGRTDAEASELREAHLMGRADPLEKTLMLEKIEGRKKRGRHGMRWLNSATNSVNMNLSKFQEIVKDREAWHAAVDGAAKSQTCLSNWTTTKSRNYYRECLGANDCAKHIGFIIIFNLLNHPWRQRYYYSYLMDFKL